MRVAIMSREYPPETGWGGIATFKYHLAHGLIALGHEVEVFSLSADGKNKARLEDGILVHRAPVHDHPHNEQLIRECSNAALSDIHRCMPHVRYVLNAGLSLWREFEKSHTERPFDVLDAPELFADSMFVAARRNVPHVIRLLTPHAKFIAENLHNIDRSLDHELVAVLERFAMYSCDVITSPSYDLANWVANDLNYPADKIMIVRDPIDCNLFNPIGTKAFVAPDKIKILFVGRLEERKGVHYLVDAIPRVVSQHPSAHFYFLGADTNTGPGGSSVLEELKQRLSRSGYQANVTFIPPVAHVQVPDYMRSADICVIPSLYDNSPFTCIEAMASGKPVIGSDAGGTPEYIPDGKAGIVVPARDSGTLADAVSELCADQSKRERYGAAARNWALTQYSREIIAGETLEVYRAAQRAFANNKGNPINMYGRDEFVGHADELANSLDLAFHRLRLQWSLRYRMQTAVHKAYVAAVELTALARQRPKLAALRVAMALSAPVLKFFPKAQQKRIGAGRLQEPTQSTDSVPQMESAGKR